MYYIYINLSTLRDHQRGTYTCSGQAQKCQYTYSNVLCTTHPRCSSVLILNPSVGDMVLMSSPLNFLSIVVLPALSSPLKIMSRILQTICFKRKWVNYIAQLPVTAKVALNHQTRGLSAWELRCLIIDGLWYIAQWSWMNTQWPWFDLLMPHKVKCHGVN